MAHPLQMVGHTDLTICVKKVGNRYTESDKIRLAVQFQDFMFLLQTHKHTNRLSSLLFDRTRESSKDWNFLLLLLSSPLLDGKHSLDHIQAYEDGGWVISQVCDERFGAKGSWRKHTEALSLPPEGLLQSQKPFHFLSHCVRFSHSLVAINLFSLSSCFFVFVVRSLSSQITLKFTRSKKSV